MGLVRKERTSKGGRKVSSELPYESLLMQLEERKKRNLGNLFLLSHSLSESVIVGMSIRCLLDVYSPVE